ncbi:PTS sugar transporter subunit IIA [Anaerosacchariphilus polymeriproducens]|uniref:PTS sugar transporter subunit IIA n=1 Tax=Anaerosacchariphilus polymeriproducens TaxID=1812858 RepID=A0A371AW87_9FIRM|nr:PTS sugar transporter subunit IIA [Anaerosacchariphilus polymeriproducens]RDU23838.1 PTS sugar transporter subunit IIA [Anaerosacchariphilus polymeriproducens]
MLKDMLKPEFVFTNVDVEGNEKSQAMKKISILCSEHSDIDTDELFSAFIAREEMDSTGFGSGVAIPHAKIKGLTSPMVAVIKFKQEIDWEAIDDQPVKVAIALVMPNSDEDNTHLQVISRFARLLVNDEFVNNLKGSTDSEELYNFIIKEVV